MIKKWFTTTPGWIRAQLLGAVGGLALVLAACYPGEVTNVQQTDLVVTVHDSSTNFGAIGTFALPDTVVQLFEDSAGSVPLSRDFDSLMLALTVENLVARGYTRELDPENNGANVIVFVSMIGLENEYYVYYPGWCSGGWGGWGGWGWWGGCWGWYYPGWVGSGSYETGTVIIAMMDPDKRETVADSVRAAMVWTGALSGILSGTASESRITSGINQAFTQSPYLRASP
jgi:hypothetical protein